MDQTLVNSNVSQVQPFRAAQASGLEAYQNIPLSDPGTNIAGGPTNRRMYGNFSLRPVPGGIPQPADANNVGSSSFRGN